MTIETVNITTKVFDNGVVGIFHQGECIQEFGCKEIIELRAQKMPIALRTTFQDNGRVHVFLNGTEINTFVSGEVYDTIQAIYVLKETK